MKGVIADFGQNLPPPVGNRAAGLVGLRQSLQEGHNLGWRGKTHVGVVSLVGEAGGRGGFLWPSAYAGCHHVPASTTPADTSRLSPIMCSPMESA